MTRPIAALVLLVALGACAKSSTTPTASAPAAMAAPAPAVNPSGRWSVALTAQGQAMDFVMELRQVNGSEYGGVVTGGGLPPMNINKATLSGNTMKVSVIAPTGDEATFDIVFEGDTFSGNWQMPGDGSRVSGRRL